MELSARRLNRTLLLRQHLLERVTASPRTEVRHLLGLQAQETPAPFFALAARVHELDPYDVTKGLEDRSMVRLLSLRGTVHLIDRTDVALRTWTQPVIDRALRSTQHVGTAGNLDRSSVVAGVRELLAAGPMPQQQLGLGLAERFPGHTPTELGHLARSVVSMVQAPPRGTWKGTGPVVYALTDQWVGAPSTELPVEDTIRRYLRAFGPASAADLTAWSGVTRLGPVVKAMPDLITHHDHTGRLLYDVADAELAEEDAAAPVRLLGRYDNLWLSHAGRDRVTTPEARSAWQGPNGGSANALFVDGWMCGLWEVRDGHVVVTETARPLTAKEKRDLAEESERVEHLLGR